jgi:hypothetical protein
MEEFEMGYVHDTQMSVFTPAEDCTGTVGTWAMAALNNVWSLDKAAANDTSIVKIPLRLPSNAAALKGALLKSVDVWWACSTAANDAVSAILYKQALPVNGTLSTAAAVTTTYDTGHDTAPERLTLDEHKMTLTVTTPEWVDEDAVYYVELTVDAALTSVDKLFGARANYTLRV